MNHKTRYSITMLCAMLGMSREEAKSHAQQMVQRGLWSEQRNDGRSRYLLLKHRRTPIKDQRKRNPLDALRGTPWAGL